MKYAWLIITAAVTLEIPQPLAPEPATKAAEFIVWNVGQGLWTTLIDDDRCIHFDTGGENAPWLSLRDACGSQQNIVHLSHWDFDHISFAGRLARRMRTLCLETPPAGEGNEHKRKILRSLHVCPVHDPSGRTIEGKAHGSKANDLSHVFIAGSLTSSALALIPGDSTRHEEKFWAERLPASRVWLLVLGHHGSRTSTSGLLLEHLPRVRMAVASSREAKYGHPHPEVVRRLRSAGIALLRTEDWGTLRFEFPKSSPAVRAGSGRIIDDKACTRGSGCGRPARKSHGRRRRSDP